MVKENVKISNSKVRDSGAKLIFENPTLCSQFLREYSGLEIFKNIQPEDVEDMTERFAPMFTEEREADVVKKVKIPELGDLFLITLIEHKSSVDFNVGMQLLRYMVYIWEDYEKNMEGLARGISKTKEFRYPPIIPIVYYEDTAEWTSAIRLKDRILLSDTFGEYLPDYQYLLFRLQDQDDEELIEKQDEISFIMLMNRMRDVNAINRLNLPEEYFDEISRKSPEDVLRVIERVVAAYLRQFHVSEDEISELTGHVRRRKMGQLFEHFEGFDLPAAREKAKTEGRAEGLAEGRAEGLAEGRAEGRAEGLAEGRIEVIDILKRVRAGEAVEDIIASGVPEETVNEVVAVLR